MGAHQLSPANRGTSWPWSIASKCDYTILFEFRLQQADLYLQEGLVGKIQFYTRGMSLAFSCSTLY